MSLNTNSSVNQPPAGYTTPQVPTITQERLRAIVMTIQTMKARGATEETDPEYAKLLNFLRAYKKQQLHLQQQQQLQHQLQHQTPDDPGIYSHSTDSDQQDLQPQEPSQTQQFELEQLRMLQQQLEQQNMENLKQQENEQLALLQRQKEQEEKLRQQLALQQQQKEQKLLLQLQKQKELEQRLKEQQMQLHHQPLSQSNSPLSQSPLQTQLQTQAFAQSDQSPQAAQKSAEAMHKLRQLQQLQQLKQQLQLKQLQQFQQKQLGDASNPSSPQLSQSPVRSQLQHHALQAQAPYVKPIFTSEQLSALKYQVYAFRLLSKNLPLSEHLKKAIFEDSIPQDDVTTPTISSRIVEATFLYHKPTSGILSNQNLHGKSSIGAKKSLPGSLKSPASNIQASRFQRLLISNTPPGGLDSMSLFIEREERVRTRTQRRLLQVEEYVDKFNQSDSTDEKVPLKAIIQLKSLRLLEEQKKLREEMVRGMKKAVTMSSSADRAALRKMKKQSLRDARIAERLEKQQRAELERREKQRHLDHLQGIITHGRDLMQWHRTFQAKQSKLGRAVVQYHSQIEREEMKRIERVSKERLRALRADDEEAYLKLIDQTKDTRITHLLQQTDVYLDSLSKAVRMQQTDALHQDPVTQGEVEAMDNYFDNDEDDHDDPDGSKLDYYMIAHRIKEDVEQPSILIGGKLKEYQIKGLQWMVSLYNNRLNGILADEMGLGKTIQTLSLITYLIERKHQNGPFLIIVPLSTLTNWNLEFEKWAPSVVKVVYKGPPNERKELYQTYIKYGNFQVLLTTFEYIIKDKNILGKVKWVHMIIDEGHRMKNVNSKLTSTLNQYYSTRYRLILTGTPLQNNLPELWALLNFVLPKVFNSVKSFDEWFNTPFANTGGQDKIEINEEESLLIIRRLHKVLRPFLLRRLKKDVESELPDKVEKVIKCKFSALQSKLYNQMRKHGMLFTTGGEKGTTGIKGLNNTIMQLRKICNHPFVFEDVERIINPSKLTNDTLFRVSGKFELLDRILPKFANTGHRVLMFFQMTTVMSIMEDFLLYRGFTYLRLDGTVKADDRTTLLKKFNAPDSPFQIFLLSTRAGGLGLNLQTADTVIIFDSDWNPHQDLQAQDRAHRIGQTKEVRILRLVSEGSVEETILARAQYKLDIDGKVIQAGKFDNKSTAEERDAFLRALLEVDNDQESDFEDDDNDDDLNELIARNDEELSIFKQMDLERQRVAEEKWINDGRRGRKPERLIQDYELPEVYRMEHDLKEEDDIEFMGRGQRLKGDVRYDDGLTEEQWLNALENDKVDVNDAIRDKSERKRRREERKVKHEDSNNETEDSNESKSKKRARLVKEESKEIEEDIGEVKRSKSRRRSEHEIPRKRRRSDRQVEDSADSEQTRHDSKSLRRTMEDLYTTVEDCTDPADGSRKRSLLFMELPSKKIYPQYYSMISQPIAMNIIKKRMRSGYYSNVRQFRDDFNLMFKNAQTFNQEGSWVYTDATIMKDAFDQRLQYLCPNEASLESIDRDNDSCEASTPRTHNSTGDHSEERAPKFSGFKIRIKPPKAPEGYTETKKRKKEKNHREVFSGSSEESDIGILED
ncbi:ATP-dependent DNA helicase Snf21 [Basidiobolus ranarum]|uniref:ATP-dependent DNA helicase Snf21 n=1 Tax=Basidiobolus ranarum TaxID=34480 RepID=A0ABR2W6S5_9FUNG